MDPAEEQHLAWLARSFGRTDYVPLTAADLAALSDAGSYVEKYPGTHLFKEGADSDAAYVIEPATSSCFATEGSGRLVVGRVGPGAVIGDIALLRGQPYISSARAVSPVEAFRLDRSKLLPVLFEHPRIAIRWLVAGLNQLESTQRRVLRLMRGTVKEQVARDGARRGRPIWRSSLVTGEPRRVARCEPAVGQPGICRSSGMRERSRPDIE